MIRLFPYTLCLLALLSTNCIGMKVRNEITLFDSATLVRSDNYVVLGKGTGQDSAFFILGMIPVTKEPNVELAMSQALEKFPGGRTLTNIQIIREDRPYFPLGLVTVVIVTADVIGEASLPTVDEAIPNPKGTKK
ncbi:MAG: hypothetical protein O9264_04910 [Leptospira sp.]|nr:hypothetical protein [Leptospira sp.]